MVGARCGWCGGTCAVRVGPAELEDIGGELCGVRAGCAAGRWDVSGKWGSVCCLRRGGLGWRKYRGSSGRG